MAGIYPFKAMIILKRQPILARTILHPSSRTITTFNRLHTHHYQNLNQRTQEARAVQIEDDAEISNSPALLN